MQINTLSTRNSAVYHATMHHAWITCHPRPDTPFARDLPRDKRASIKSDPHSKIKVKFIKW